MLLVTTSREHKDTNTSREEHLESIKRTRTVPVEWRSISREHSSVIPEDLLEAHTKASEKMLKIESRGMMMSSIQSSCSSQKVLEFLRSAGVLKD